MSNLRQTLIEISRCRAEYISLKDAKLSFYVYQETSKRETELYISWKPDSLEKE